MSKKKTVNLLEDEKGLLLCCHILRGELHSALNCRSFTVTKQLSEIDSVVKYSAAFDKYFMLCPVCLYESPDGQSFTIVGPLNNEKSEFLEFYNSDGNACYVAYNTERSIVYDGNYSFPTGGPTRMKHAVWHCGRAFFVSVNDGFTVGWSAPTDILNSDESIDKGGWVRLDTVRGKIIDLIEYGESIVAVREYGLTLLNMMGSPENYKAKITDTDTRRIYGHTAQCIGGKIIFCTSAGICSFDGSKISKLPCRYFDEADNVLCAAAFGGKYYINCYFKILQTGAIICYDPENADCYIMPIKLAGAGSLCAGKDIRVYNDTGCYFIEGTQSYEFQSGEINFGSRAKKTVTEIYIDGVADVEISNGSIKRTFENAKGKIRPHLKGESFTFKLTAKTADNPSIRAFTATAEVCDAV